MFNYMHLRLYSNGNNQWRTSNLKSRIQDIIYAQKRKYVTRNVSTVNLAL